MGNSILFNTAGSIALAINYEMMGPYTEKFLSKEADTQVRINSEVFIRVGDAILCIESDVDITEADLDTGSNFAASTTYYIYGCQPLDGSSAPVFRISLNATYPSGGWDADTSRQIGGFATDGDGYVNESTLWDLRTNDITVSSYTDADARGAINDIFGSDGKADSNVDMDGHDLENVGSVIAQTVDATAQANDVDFNGYYLTGLQNIADLMARGPGYWFDGSDDNISIPDNVALDIGTGDFSAIIDYMRHIIATDDTLLGSRVDGGNGVQFHASSVTAAELDFYAMVGSTIAFRATTSGYGDTTDVRACAALVVDRDVGNYVYKNGKAQTLGTDTKDDGANDIDLGASWQIGSYSTFHYCPCAIFRVLMFNLALTAAEIKAYSSGAPIPYKYIGASQTPVTSFDGTSAAGWGINYGTLLANQAIGGEQALKITIDSSANQHAAYVAHGGVVGKRYRLTFDYYIPSGNSHLDGIWADQNNNDVFMDIGASTDTWNSGSLEFTLTAASAYLKFYGMDGATRTISDPGGDDYFGLDNIALTPIGCVLDLSPDGIGHGQWIDQSGNELHGTVSGAIPINLPVDHTEKYIDLTVTGDTTFPWPAGYMITAISTKETEGNAVTGGLNFGITNGGAQIVSAHTVSASTAAICSLVAGGNYNTTGAADTGYITAVTAWNSANVQVRITMQKIDMD